MPIPETYLEAHWRCTLCVDDSAQETGIGFTRPDGSVVRLRLTVTDARHLAESLTETLGASDCKAPTETSLADLMTEISQLQAKILADVQAIKRDLKWRT